MRVLQSGKNKGHAEFYYSIGFDCGDFWNGVKCVIIEDNIKNEIMAVANEYDEEVKFVSVRKIRTNNSKTIWTKSAVEFQ